MVHIYVGDGKGKNTASIGISIRAAGHGLSVLFVQFLKNDSSGEISVLRSISGITVLHCPVNFGFFPLMTKEQIAETAEEYDKMLDYSLSADADLIILDEVIHALNLGMIDRKKLEIILDKN